MLLTAPLAAEGASSCLTDSCHPLSKVRERGEKENMKAKMNTTVPSMTTALVLGIAQPVPRRTRDVGDEAIPWERLTLPPAFSVSSSTGSFFPLHILRVIAPPWAETICNYAIWESQMMAWVMVQECAPEVAMQQWRGWWEGRAKGRC